MNSFVVQMPEGVEKDELMQVLTAAVKEGVKEAFAPLVRLQCLKEKPFLKPCEVEELYDLAEASLLTWRSRGGGPKFVQRQKGAPVAYEHPAIIRFKRGDKPAEGYGSGYGFDE